MATIKPFKAMKARPEQAHQLKRIVETMALQPAASAREQLAMAGAGGNVAELYDHVPGNLDILLRDGMLEASAEPAMFIYETVTAGNKQRGLWALTSYNDLLTGRIKKHELTIRRDVEHLKNYREQTHMDGSPVLITYQPESGINELLDDYARANQPEKFDFGGRQHKLWQVTDVRLISRLTACFAGLGTVYLADGHHRTAAIGTMLEEQYGNQPMRDDNPAAYFSTLYIAEDQLQIREYYRLFRPAQPIDHAALFKVINRNFEVIQSGHNAPVSPCKLHHFGMCKDGYWYELKANKNVLASSLLTDKLDVSILHNYILQPAFNVTDARTDERLECIGGPEAMKELAERLKAEPYSIGFTMCPVSVNQLISIAYTDGIMPPKSTWVEPKIPFGLLMYKF